MQYSQESKITADKIYLLIKLIKEYRNKTTNKQTRHNLRMKAEGLTMALNIDKNIQHYTRRKE